MGAGEGCYLFVQMAFCRAASVAVAAVGYAVVLGYTRVVVELVRCRELDVAQRATNTSLRRETFILWHNVVVMLTGFQSWCEGGLEMVLGWC